LSDLLLTEFTCHFFNPAAVIDKYHKYFQNIKARDPDYVIAMYLWSSKWALRSYHVLLNSLKGNKTEILMQLF